MQLRLTSAHEGKGNGLDDLKLPTPKGTVILVSGVRQAGKSTLLLHLRAAAIRAGLSVGGVLSVARTAGGEKTGIDLMNAATGETIPLATAGGPGALRTEHYTFDPAALAEGQRYAAAGQAADVFLVDELGPLELERDQGWIDVIVMLSARAFGVALVVVRPELIAGARERLRLPSDSPLIVVETANRDALRVALSEWISRWAAAQDE